MDKFINITKSGQERAIKRGVRVPDDAVNMAWVKTPKLTPENNIIIVDTSRNTQENAVDDQLKLKVMYANSVGILEDENGNQVIQEEYPFIADVFSIDEDFSKVPGSEYKSKHVLPFLHTSRYFHIDFPGLTLGTIAQTYKNDALKVIDDNGKEYIDDTGQRRYRLQIVPARQNIVANQANAAYRVLVYLDTDQNENLYLTYNKVEISPEGYINNQDINYREIVNPQPYFTYKPEESDVVDLNNRKRRWYSTKPITLKEQVLNVPHPDIEGYKVYVPKKAIPDPRTFQLFRWRVVCDMVENFQIDPLNDLAAIRCGVLVTNSTKSTSPYAFYNLGLSQFNQSKVNYINPAQENLITKPDKSTTAYWEVNLDNISAADLELYDILLLAPSGVSFDTGTYNTKIRYFTESLGRTLIVETANAVQLANFGFTTSRAANTTTGAAMNPGPGTYAKGTTIRPATNAFTDSLFDGSVQLGGWNLGSTNTSALNSLSPYKNAAYTTQGYVQYIVDAPSDYVPMIVANRSDDVTVSVVVKKSTSSGGNIIVSTIGAAQTASALFSSTTGKFLYSNIGSTIVSTPDYVADVSASAIEGVMKLFYNINLLGVKATPIDKKDDHKYSSAWQYASPWESSWVINGSVLTDQERDQNDFVFLPKDPTILTPVWQRKLSNKTIKQLINDNLTADELTRTSSAARTYSIEFTNNKVFSATHLGDSSNAYAYTEAYTAAFAVPVELGAHIIKNEDIKPGYDSAQYIYKSYPPKPFKLNVQANYEEKSTYTTNLQLHLIFNGFGTGTYNTTTTTGGTGPTSSEASLIWSANGSGQIAVSPDLFEYQSPIPVGMRTWQECNYHVTDWGQGNEAWGFYGLVDKYDIGSSGETVTFIQEAMNRFFYLKYFGMADYLKLDGQYGNATKTAVKSFQQTFQLRYQDGVVDAETFGCIGTQVLRYIQAGLTNTINPNDHTKWFGNIVQNISVRNISDGNANTQYLQRSWSVNGPDIIWNLVGITYNQAYPIHAITFIPHVSGTYQSMMLRSIDVKTIGNANNLPGILNRYDASTALVSNLPYRPSHGEQKYVPIGPYTGDTIIIGFGQDTAGGFGTSRFMGIKEIWAHTTVAGSGSPGTTVTGTGTKTTPIVSEYFVPLKTGQVDVTYPTPPENQSNLTDIHWTSVSPADSNPKIHIDVFNTSDGYIDHVVATNSAVSVEDAGTHFTQGSNLPDVTGGLYYINEISKANPLPETGWISKSNGIKLLCDNSGNPTGFPPLPTAVGSNTQRDYATLTINNLGKDPSIVVGFYDFVKKEFIVNKLGVPEMTYGEYASRGPQNVYVGLISTYEVASNKTLPPDNNAPSIPFKWAMPVYGLCTKNNSNIGIEPLPTGLGPSDIWSVPIRTGSFNKLYDIRSKINGVLNNWISDYQGTKVRAFYSVVEAERGGWSTIFGRPQIDIVGETPIILDDKVVQVRQAPIFMIKEPTQVPSFADPVNPIFNLYTRNDLSAPWILMNKGDILDYNVSEGTIFLRNALKSSDPNLIKIDYTTGRRIYPFKSWNGNKLNLNPYPGHSRDYVGKPIYIYIVPAYVKNNLGVTIDASVQQKTLRFTLDHNIFNQTDPNYDPLAIQLGVIYITSALNIEDLIMLDTRRRGGGVNSNVTKQDMVNLNAEAIGYWDIGFGSGLSYQKGGYVVIRLPDELKTRFSLEEIQKIISRNLPIGVSYKLQDLFGNDWN